MNIKGFQKIILPGVYSIKAWKAVRQSNLEKQK